MGMLPVDIATYITMHMELPEYNTYEKLYKFILKYVKVIRNLKRAGHRPAHLVAEANPEQMPGLITEPVHEEMHALMDRLLAAQDDGDVDEQIEVLAVMKRRNFQPPTRGQGGQRQRAPLQRFAPRTVGTAGGREPPPRSRVDMTCVNCGRKGHGAG